MLLTLTIAGVNRNTHFMLPGTSADISATLMTGGRGSLRLKVYDLLGASGYRPAIDDTLVLTAPGPTTLFSGRIDAVHETSLTQWDTGVVTEITASDWAAIFDQVSYTKPAAAGLTLKQMLTTIVSALFAYGVTLDAAQVNGPTSTTTTTFAGTVTDALNRLQALTGYIWRIDENKKLRAIAAGTVDCGFTLSDADTSPGVLGTVGWKQARATNYCNQALVKIGPAQALEKSDAVIGNGVVTAQGLTYTPIQNAATNFILSRGYVSENTSGSIVNWPIGIYGVDAGLMWYYDFALNRIVRAAALPTGTTATFQYQVQFPITVSYTDTVETAAHNVYSQTFDAPNITGLAEGLVLATSLVRRAITTPRTVTVVHNKGLALPGQTVFLSFAERAIAGTFMIVQVDIASAVDATLEYTLTCVSGSEVGETWLDYYRHQGGAGAAIGGGGGTTFGVFLSTPPAQFSGSATAWAGTNGMGVDGLNRFESSLDAAGNASSLGPALKLGRDADIWQWAVLADTLGGSTPGTSARIKFIASKDSGTYRYAMALAQADTPASGDYYLIPSVLGRLFLGAPVGAFGGFSGAARIEAAFVNAGVYEAGRAAAMGYFTTFAGTFGASAGAWNSITSTRLAFTLVGKRLEIEFTLDSGNVTAAPAELWLTLPLGLVAAAPSGNPFQATNQGTTAVGWARVVTNDTVVRFQSTIGGAGWLTTAGNDTNVRGKFSCEVQ